MLKMDLLISLLDTLHQNKMQEPTIEENPSGISECSSKSYSHSTSKPISLPISIQAQAQITASKALIRSQLSRKCRESDRYAAMFSAKRLSLGEILSKSSSAFTNHFKVSPLRSDSRSQLIHFTSN